MEKKAMMIRSGASFMVNAIQKNLEEAGYAILPVDATVAAVNAKHRETDILIFYLGDFVSEASELLVYLKDLCTEEDKLLILIGNPMELATVEETIPAALVAASFERPLDIKKLIDELERLVQVNDENARRKSILLVDDDNAFLKMLTDLLSGTYRITPVTSGAQALMYIADNKPDLILLDYEMPVTSGPKVLEMFKSDMSIKDIPVMFLTGKGDKESIMSVLALKPVGYLLKTSDRNKIRESIGNYFTMQKAKK